MQRPRDTVRKTDPLAKRLGRRVRDLRQERGWSQGELARRVAVTVPTISSWEHGVKLVSVRRLAKLADALEVPVDRLLREAPAPTRLKDPELAWRLQMVEQCGPEERRAAAGLLDLLIGLRELAASRTGREGELPAEPLSSRTREHLERLLVGERLFAVALVDLLIGFRKVALASVFPGAPAAPEPGEAAGPQGAPAGLEPRGDPGSTG